MAANGERGLNQMCNVFADEISFALAQLGLCRMSDVSEASLSGAA